MATDFRIRPCTLWDAREIFDLLQETWMSTYAPILGPEGALAHGRRLSRFYVQLMLLRAVLRQNLTLKAVLDGRLVGMTMAVKDEDGVVVYLLYVHPEFQNKGIGRSLLEAIERRWPKARKIRLEVLQKNTRAVAWYQAQGFEIYGSNKVMPTYEAYSSYYMDKPIGGAAEPQ